ncbi:MAG: methyltransferase domain-containing protein [Desulfovermiculus sp.]|nr:methyltransferase domain-containing protein [Desulfovermiculus sp.]
MKNFLQEKIRGTRFEPFFQKFKASCRSSDTRAVSAPTSLHMGVTEDTGLDHTQTYDYDRLIAEEKEHYSEIEITERLTEGGKHAHPAWEHYWHRVSRDITREAGVYGKLVEYIQSIAPADQTIRILSLGSGYCGHELMIAEQFSQDYEIECVDINENLFHQARQKATDKGLHLAFGVEDLNFIQIKPQNYDFIFAHAVLHHIINLEHLYAQIAQGLTDIGLFHLIEVAGENRRLLWPENQNMVNGLLDLCPKDVVGQHRIHVSGGGEGMEGVRQEDILPLLKERFSPEFEHLHGAFMRYVCLDENLAPLLNPERAQSKKYLDFLIDCDQSCVRRGLLKPLEIWGVYRPREHPLDQEWEKNAPGGQRHTQAKAAYTLSELFRDAPCYAEPHPSAWSRPLEHQRQPLERLFEFTDVRGKAVLEVGADDPALLFQLQKQGMSCGLGINNWYWEGKKHQPVKVTENVVMSYGDIRSLPLADESFDLVFTVAAFEHIHDLPAALEEMYRLLKPGGLVYSYFGPLWSSGVGHHLYFEHKGVWYTFPDKESTRAILQDYEHLIFDREEMKAKLSNRWDSDTVNAFIYQIYDHQHINRYMYSDYMRMFAESDFQLAHMDNLGRMNIDSQVYEQLTVRYGPEEDFTCATMEVVLKK